jgi:preprotein translocase subunit SecY
VKILSHTLTAASLWQRAGKRPLNVENTVVLILVISVVIGGIIFYLSSSKKLPVQHGVAAGARGWG